MTATIIEFTGLTTQDSYAEKILRAAIDANLDKCVVVGREQNGNLWFSGNHSDAYEILFLLEFAKRELLSILCDDEEPDAL